MKKTFSVVLVLLLLTTLFTSCKDTSQTSTNSSSESHTDIKDVIEDYVQISPNEDINNFFEDSESQVLNIALFGIETNTESSLKGKSTSVIVASLNKQTKKIKLVSFVHHTIVDIDGKKDRLSSAYEQGGYELAVRTLNRNFNLNIKDFVTVNFERMAQMVDLLGGVDIEVNDGEFALINPLIEEQATIIGEPPHTLRKAAIKNLTVCRQLPGRA